MYTVIVADDEEEIRRSLIRKVNWGAAGFQVIGEAENDVEALELVEKLEPDLLLTDIRAPTAALPQTPPRAPKADPQSLRRSWKTRRDTAPAPLNNCVFRFCSGETTVSFPAPC